MRFVWSEDKNIVLRQQRNISFEQIVLAIENEQVVDVLEHPNKEKYKGQKFVMVEMNNYIYVVPAFIDETEEECRLITIYPSRKYTDKYLKEEKNEKN